MRKIISFLCALSIVFIAPEVSASIEPNISAAAVALINAETGEVLYGENETEKLPMASTTKIMTALLSIEAGNLDEKFTVDSNAIRVEGTSMGLKEGDKVTLYELCVGMLLSSGNDAANAAAVRVGGSIEAFVEMMNEKAEKLSLTSTNFETVSGLDSKGHGSSALDMARLGAKALENEVFKSICSSKSVKVCFGQPEIQRTLYNHNKLLTLDEDIIGVKTGYTKKAGRCLVSAKEVDGITLVAVTLNASDDWNAHIKLFDYGFSKVQTKTSAKESFSVSVVGGEKDKIALISSSAEISYIGDITEKIFLPQFAYAPINEGDKIGEKRFYSGGKEISSAPIFAAESIALFEKEGIIQKIKRFFASFFG
ncbi:MAG: D-alanyl-D-alanine carboxypeptidase [Oscillospiraceae bacterium]|nr:D-alanyl-D-alanine carboxypeptidase [Oscillospiraceae bacterium]